MMDLVPVSTELTVAHGPIGKKQSRLKKWLWETNIHTHAERKLDETGGY